MGAQPSLPRGCRRGPGVHPGAGGEVEDSSVAAALLASNEQPNFEPPLRKTEGCSHWPFRALTIPFGALETRPLVKSNL